MDKVVITIEYRPMRGEVFRLQNTVSLDSYMQSSDVLEYAARNSAKQFSHELDMELANLAYAPKMRPRTLADRLGITDPSSLPDFYRGANA